MSDLESNTAEITSTILDEIQHNADSNVDKYIDTMTADQLDKLFDSIKSPYSFSLPGNHAFTNMSYTNLRENYVDKFNTVAKIAFLFRTLDEYKVPAECEPVSMERYIADPSIIEPQEHDLEDNRKMGKITENIEWMKHKVHVYNFLIHAFKYNPDKHVRIAYRPNPKDPERTPVDTKVSRLGLRRANSVRTRTGKLRGTRIGKMNKKTLANLAAHRRVVSEEKKEINEELTESNIEKAELKTEEETSTTTPSFKTLATDPELPTIASIDEGLTMKSENLTMKSENTTLKKIEDIVREVIPPADYFYFFDKFKSVHYAKLHKATVDLYPEKHDMDIAFNIHEQHKTIEEADAYRHKHKEDTPHTIHTIQNNGWVFVGPWEQNRERMEYYNKHTSVMEAIMEQNQEDSKIVKDIVNNRVRLAKEANVAEVGPDDPSFLRFKASNRPEVARMGAVNINDPMYVENDDLTLEEENSEYKTTPSPSSTVPIVPESESIEVGVISLSKGGKSMTTGIMHTRAFAPDQEEGAMPTDNRTTAELKNKIR